MDLPEDIKQRVVAKCYEYVESRITNAQDAINHAQESANAEGKSSMGDKYETGRAMAQLEKEKALGQLNEALALRNILDQLKAAPRSEMAIAGSLVVTKNLIIFLSIGAGKLLVDQFECLVVAPASPLGKNILKLRQGDHFTFNKQTEQVLQIF